MPSPLPFYSCLHPLVPLAPTAISSHTFFPWHRSAPSFPKLCLPPHFSPSLRPRMSPLLCISSPALYFSSALSPTTRNSSVFNSPGMSSPSSLLPSPAPHRFQSGAFLSLANVSLSNFPRFSRRPSHSPLQHASHPRSTRSKDRAHQGSEEGRPDLLENRVVLVCDRCPRRLPWR